MHIGKDNFELIFLPLLSELLALMHFLMPERCKSSQQTHSNRLDRSNIRNPLQSR